MGAKEVCRKTVWVVAAIALLAMGTAAEVRAEAAATAGKALVAVYNAGPAETIDVTAMPSAGIPVVLAKSLKLGNVSLPKFVQAGKLTFDIRLGTVRGRVLGKLEAGHTYCAIVGSPHGFVLVDVTNRARGYPNLGKLCSNAATTDMAP